LASVSELVNSRVERAVKDR